MLSLSFIRNFNMNFKLSSFNKLAYFSTSQPRRLDLSWRTSKKLPINPMDRGVLTDGPDYTFLDGRPTPFGMKQKRKLLLQREYAKKIVELSESLDLAKECYAKKIGAKEEQIKEVLDRKLKPKGNKNIVNT